MSDGTLGLLKKFAPVQRELHRAERFFVDTHFRHKFGVEQIPITISLNKYVDKRRRKWETVDGDTVKEFGRALRANPATSLAAVVEVIRKDVHSRK